MHVKESFYMLLFVTSVHVVISLCVIPIYLRLVCISSFCVFLRPQVVTISECNLFRQELDCYFKCNL